MRKVIKYCVTLAMLLVTIISMTHPTHAYSNRIFFSHPWDTSWDTLLPAKTSAQPYKYSGNELSKKFFDNHRLRQRMSRDAGKASRRSWIAVGASQADGGNYDTNNGLNLYDFHARQYDPNNPQFLSPDKKAGDYPWLSPYTYCAGNPIMNVDIDGKAWKRFNNEGVSSFAWVSLDESYDKDGNLHAGLYEQAILFTAEGRKGKYDSNKKYNIGTSTAIVYKSDGTTEEFDACTNPSDPEKYPTIPEGDYEAKMGIHHGKYPALRLGDIGTKNFNLNKIT